MPSFQEVELGILRRMSATQKLLVSQSLWHTAWALKTAGVRRQHPDWSDLELQAEVRAIFGRDT